MQTNFSIPLHAIVEALLLPGSTDRALDALLHVAAIDENRAAEYGVSMEDARQAIRSDALPAYTADVELVSSCAARHRLAVVGAHTSSGGMGTAWLPARFGLRPIIMNASTPARAAAAAWIEALSILLPEKKEP